MPGIGGIELRRRLHEIDPDMKFIFLTGHGSNDDFVVGSTEGSFYLTKPLRLDKLIEIIKEVLK
jgi:DNA-binding NtrC family response regulator